jgi:hypothetical protein
MGLLCVLEGKKGSLVLPLFDLFETGEWIRLIEENFILLFSYCSMVAGVWKEKGRSLVH